MPKRRKPAETGPFGATDGRPFDGVLLKLSTSKRWARLPAEGERMLLVVEGRAYFRTVKVGEEFVREHVFEVDAIGEAEDELAADVEEHLRLLADLQGGSQRLPLDGEDPEGTGPSVDEGGDDGTG